jgi:acyl-CoA reductase-like NAD-dependent aldehyde dehydrogenase
MTRVTVEYEEPKLLIGGELVDAADGETFPTENPATGDHLTEIPRANERDVERAVAAAKEGFEVWSTEFSARDRAKKLDEVADLLRQHSDRLGAIDAADAGNPVSAMRTDPFIAAEYTETMASFALENKGETTPVSTDTFNYTLRQPYGVVARIIPFNHPILFAGSKPAAPLVAGNSVVLKPPEQASISALELGRLLTEADILPDGVLNILTGFGDEVGSPLVTHGDIHKIGFTGSVPTGAVIQKQAADTVADVSLELGGKNPLLAYPDADLDDVVEGALEGMNLGWQGESCGSISRLFLHESQYEEGVDRLAAKVEEVDLGDPLDDETEMGALTDEAQYEKSRQYIDLAQTEGATL